MYEIVRSQGGDGWVVRNTETGMIVGEEFRGQSEASDYMKSLMAQQDTIDNDGDDGGEGVEKEFDWEGKFNLDLKDLMNQYGVASDMQKYFEGMEYDP